MNDKLFRSMILVLLLLMFNNCGNYLQSKTSRVKIAGNRKKSDHEKLPFSNKFGFKIFRIINSSEQGQNICVSPFSVNMALGMCYNGARGETAREIENVLSIKEIDRNNFNRTVENYSKYISGLDSIVNFEIGNSIWIRDNFPVAKDFVETNKKYYNARVENIDFNNNEVVNRINNWVAETTHNKITKIVQPPLSTETIMFLINAIYFNADWTNQFNPKNTSEDIFYTSDSSQIECDMMQQKSKFRYLTTESCQLVELPYGNGKFRMVIALPSNNKELDSLIGSLSAEKWQQWMKNMHTEEIKLLLPKFRMEYKSALNPILIEMGMAAAFDPDKSNFAGINENLGDKIYIDEVLHKTFLEVDEKGTEAAAVTSARMSLTAVYPPEKPLVMRVDHPFLFAIREKESENLLFIGKLERP